MSDDVGAHPSTVSWSVDSTIVIAGVTLDRLQHVMNAATRMLCSVDRPVSNLLCNHMHWLRVPQRIQFKPCLLMYKALHGMAPDYLRLPLSVCQRRRCSRFSPVYGNLIVTRAVTKFGDKAFAISGLLMWNSLPMTVRNSSTLSNFKSALKTHLFI